MQICPVHHGSKRGIQHTQFAGNAEISVTSQGLFHSSLIQLYRASLTRPNGPNHVFQHLFVLLQKPTSAVIAQNAKELVFVVSEMSIIFFFLASVFHILATKRSFWPDPLSFCPASTFCFPTEPERFGILILTNSAEIQCRNHALTRTGPISEPCFQSRTDGTPGQS